MRTHERTTVRSREIGEELRRVRHNAKLSAPDITDAFGWSVTKLSKLEWGQRGTGAMDLGLILGRCSADNATRERIETAATGPDSGTIARLHHGVPDTVVALYASERLAQTITVYEPSTVPALAQTRDYAHALAHDHVLVDARMDRQHQLRTFNGPHIVLYIHETACRLVVGDPKVMREQLLYLCKLSKWAKTTLRVIPESTRHDVVLLHPAALMTLKGQALPVAYTETDAATVFHDDPRAADRYRDKMERLDAVALNEDETLDVLLRWANSYGPRRATT